MKAQRKAAALGLFFLTAILPAAAQFEVSPDRFDQPSAQSPASVRSQRADHLARQIATEETLLSAYETRIRAAEQQVESDWQAAVSTWPGDEAGQMIAFNIHQRQLRQLKESLAPLIQEAGNTLASLEKDQANMTQVVTPVASRRAHSQPRRDTSTLVASR